MGKASDGNLVNALFVFILAICFLFLLLIGYGYGLFIGVLESAPLLVFIILLIVIQKLKSRDVGNMDDEQMMQSGIRHEQDRGGSFMIPTYCPECRERIALEDIMWLDSSSFVCNACGSMIRVKIAEETY